MKIPTWKRWLSYLYEIPVEQSGSEYNPYLELVISKGRYQLASANAVYSFDDLYTNYYRAFEAIHIKEKDFKHVLVLGLGLGSIPYMLEKHFHQKLYFTTVEIDEEVIYLAQKYRLDELDSPIQSICTNALTFVKQCQEQYDLVCMDVFIDDVIPDACQQIEFLADLKRLIAPKGILLYNCLALTKEDKIDSSVFFQGAFKSVFPKGDYLDVEGNYILMNKGVLAE